MSCFAQAKRRSACVASGPWQPDCAKRSALHRQGVEVHVAVDNSQQLQQQLLKARGYYHLRWLACQLQLLGPVLTALVSYKLWRDWLRIPGETWAVLKSKTRRANLLRCCLVLHPGGEGGGVSGRGEEMLGGEGFQGGRALLPRGGR